MTCLPRLTVVRNIVINCRLDKTRLFTEKLTSVVKLDLERAKSRRLPLEIDQSHEVFGGQRRLEAGTVRSRFRSVGSTAPVFS